MLGGQRAFGGKSLPDTLAKILHEEPAELSGLPSALERTLEKCLAKDPVERYQHADDLAVDLRHLAARAPVVESQAATENAVISGGMKMVVASAILSAFAIGVSFEYFFGTPGAGSEADSARSLPVQITEFSTSVESPAISPSSPGTPSTAGGRCMCRLCQTAHRCG
jgi:serine/threonine protein kinase